MNPDPLSIPCPDCRVGVGHLCMDKSGARSRSHDHRVLQLVPHPAKEIPCQCGALVGELCINLGCRTKRNTNYHADRDEAAYAAGLGSAVPGLVYPNGALVRQPWCVSDRARKSDGVRSVRFRVPGQYNPTLWASSFDSKIWYGAQWKDRTLKAAQAARDSIIDAVAALAKGAETIWDKEVLQGAGPDVAWSKPDPNEAPAHWGDCDHSPCTGH